VIADVRIAAGRVNVEPDLHPASLSRAVHLGDDERRLRLRLSGVANRE
jgi:hypothetical protein